MSETPTLHIRRAVPADAEPLARHMAEWFLAAYSHASSADNTAAFVAANFAMRKQAAEIVDPQIVTLIAEADGAMAGYAQVRFATSAPPDITEPDPAEVGRFYFAPAYHGRGSAAQLMHAVRAVARERGRRWLWLLVWQEAPQAIRFYEKHGFEKAGTAVFMVGNDRKADWVLRAPVDHAA
jgi:diamine N-acetyltransferase